MLPSPKPDKEVWYPVVDLDLNAGMNGVLRWETAPRVVAVNHHFHGQVETGKTEMPVSAEILESWENSVYSEPAVALQDFYLAARVPVINGALKYSVASLAETWAGTVTMLDTATGQEVEVLRIEPKPFVSAQIGGAPAIWVSGAEGRRDRDGDGRTCELGQERAAAKRRHLGSRKN